MKNNETAVTLCFEDWIRVLAALSRYSDLMRQDSIKAEMAGWPVNAQILTDEMSAIDALIEHIEFATPELL